jgi:NNP family nitrate/nitrite transporter-like MFS transporter
MVHIKSRPGSQNSFTPVLYLAVIAMFSLLSRVVFSPLLPTIEDELHITHGQAGSLFFYISFGFTTSMLASGFVSRALTHRLSIFVSALTGGFALLGVSFCPYLWCMRLFLVILGAGSGLYLPSAMSTITSVVKPDQRGRAISIHEIGFNMSFISAPLLARLLLPLFSWRVIIRIIAVLIAAVGIAFILFGDGGHDRGKPPHLNHIRQILSQSSFWIIAVLFALAIGAEVGVFSIIPTYLVKEKGIDLDFVNTLLSLSRVSGLPMVFVTGWLVDRIGIKPLLVGVLGTAAIFTALIGITDGALLIVAVFLQPLVIICFFPAAMSGIITMGPPELLSLATSLMVPFSYLFGAGLVPAGMGFLGEQGAFSTGFYLTGGSLLAGLILIFFMHLPNEDKKKYILK